MEEGKEKPKAKPVLFELDVNHLCWFCDITDRDPDATLVSTLSQVEGDRITNVIQLNSPNPQKDIERIKAHPLVKGVQILTISPNSALLVVTSS